MKNFNEIEKWIYGWYSQEMFIQQGFGFCLLHGDTVGSRCVADCVLGKRCELGISTHSSNSKRSLASMVAAAAVEHCLEFGINQIGWHCLSSNAGSIAVAHKVGFIKTREYCAFSSELPSENASDLAPEEYKEWAANYEVASKRMLKYAYFAAGVWALAGNSTRALENLGELVVGDFKVQPELSNLDWMFTSLHGGPEFEDLYTKLHN